MLQTVNMALVFLITRFVFANEFTNFFFSDTFHIGFLPEHEGMMYMQSCFPQETLQTPNRQQSRITELVSTQEKIIS